MRVLIVFLRFWYDLIVGDCWQLAAGIALVLSAGIALLRSEIVPSPILPILLGAGVMILVASTVLFEARANLGLRRKPAPADQGKVALAPRVVIEKGAKVKCDGSAGM